VFVLNFEGIAIEVIHLDARLIDIHYVTHEIV